MIVRGSAIVLLPCRRYTWNLIGVRGESATLRGVDEMSSMTGRWLLSRVLDGREECCRG